MMIRAAAKMSGVAFILSTTAALSAAPIGTTFHIDLNTRLSPAGSGWNILGAAGSPTSAALVDSNGDSSTVSLTVPALQDSASDGWDPANPLPAWAPIEVANDYSFFNNDSSFVVTGLDPEQQLDVELLMSRNLTGRLTDITIDGTTVTWDAHEDGYVAGNTLVFQNVTADLTGNLSIDMVVRGTSTAVNAMRITIVPEPATMGLLALGGLMVLGRSRPPTFNRQ